MADTTPTETKISIKVFVDKVKQRVVYAEADYTFIDILFSFMTLPTGTIVRLLGKHEEDKKFECLKSLNNLYQSLVDFPECYFATKECKYLLLNPRSVSYYHCRNLKLRIDDAQPMKYFLCSNRFSAPCGNGSFFSICDKAKCRTCGWLMNESTFFEFGVLVDGGVFVSDIQTFIVTDDFSVTPYTAAGIFRLLRNFGISNTNHLEERKIEIGRQQILSLLKMALSVDRVFTHFLFSSTPVNKNFASSTISDHMDFKVKEASKASKMVVEAYVQKSTGKLLFAEAKDDFVDFIFGILSIPLGTIIGTLLDGISHITSMDNLFRSISSMSVGRYLKTHDIKDMLVKPHFGQEYVSINQVFSLKGDTSSRKLNYGNYQPKDPRVNNAFVKQSGIYIVTDDLVITPSSSHLAMNTLDELQVPFDDVETHEISIGLEEALRMLRAMLLCRSTLTTSLQHLIKK